MYTMHVGMCAYCIVDTQVTVYLLYKCKYIKYNVHDCYFSVDTSLKMNTILTYLAYWTFSQQDNPLHLPKALFLYSCYLKLKPTISFLVASSAHYASHDNDSIPWVECSPIFLLVLFYTRTIWLIFTSPIFVLYTCIVRT